MKTKNTDAPILLQENTSKIKRLRSYLTDVERHINDVLDQYGELEGDLSQTAPLKFSDMSQLASNAESVIRKKLEQTLKPNELRVGQHELSPEKVASLISLPDLGDLRRSAIELSELINSIKSDDVLGRVDATSFIELSSGKAAVVEKEVSSFIDEKLRSFAKTKDQIALYNAAKQIAEVLNDVIIPINRGKIYQSDWGFDIDFDQLLKKLVTVKKDTRKVSINEAMPEVVVDPDFVKRF